MGHSMIKVLHYTDAEEWSTVASEANAIDVYFSPEYLRANEAILGGESECFVYREGATVVLYPYIKRQIHDSNLFDITSPYGFGGQIKYPNDVTVTRFNDTFHGYCQKSGIVSEFVRFHPLYGNHTHIMPSPMEIHYHQPVVYVDFDANDSDFRQGINKHVWKKIRKAQKSGVKVIEDTNGEFYEDFVRLYQGTMAFKEAAQFYYFNDGFFSQLNGLLRDQSLLFVATYEGKMIGGLLMLFGDSFAYNYLSCSDRKYHALGINDVLQFAALNWAYRNGKRQYLLGGGLNGEDSVFRFKAKFSPTTKGFYLGKRIHLPQVYDRLCEQKMCEEGSSRADFYSRSWFPLYRSEAPKKKQE
jgi:hypothetical protein